ncbi:MAG: choline kinase family protein [Gammaproteobacteria bacterium]|nr:choline kinase family protein [Gammaproteobacteria bacterium]
MSTREAPETVLQTIPDWQDATLQKLPGGLTNCAWLVESRGRQAVLKIDASPRVAPFGSREDEARVQSNAAANGLAGTVLFVNDTVYLSEYVDGEVWSADSLADDANLERLARSLRKLHSLPLTGRTFDARAAARGYAARIDSADAARARDCLRLIESMPRLQQLCCCHNDLVAENIIATPGIRFLDWEYACDNDPFFDLATIVAHHRLSEARARYLLDAYFDGDGRRWQERLDAMAHFYDALLWLWLQARSPGD